MSIKLAKTEIENVIQLMVGTGDALGQTVYLNLNVYRNVMASLNTALKTLDEDE